MQRQIRWAAVNQEGLEQLNLSVGDQAVKASSVVIGGNREEGATWAISYEVECDQNWHTRRVKVINYDTGKQVELFSDGQGNWTASNGEPLKELAGCFDVDIQATPFTNTLPIRRLNLEPGKPVEIKVAFVPLPELTPFAHEQRYTLLVPGRYRFEAVKSDFTAELTTDADGLVIEYAGLFHRTL
jgi:hypothetical protein